MYELSDKLKKRVEGLSQSLEEKYNNFLNLNREDFRVFINKELGQLKAMKKLDRESLNSYQEAGGLVGVDGSNNRLGGAYPHFVEAYQALAKSSIKENQAIFLADIYSPLDQEEPSDNPLEDGEGGPEEQKNIRLASLEIEVALDSIKANKPFAIMMDGGLIRYNIYAYDKWMELRQTCEQEEILLIGVIKDIKTSIIGDIVRQSDSSIKGHFYDRELLFGQMNYGELLLIDDQVNKKSPEGYSSAFLRSSLAPSPIGMDILDSQKEHLEEMARLVFTLTPENSRGVPLWLDMVDKEVQISDEIMKALFERYMDRGIYERFFISERDKRQ